jgi:hypothetical protein
MGPRFGAIAIAMIVLAPRSSIAAGGRPPLPGEWIVGMKPTPPAPPATKKPAPQQAQATVQGGRNADLELDPKQRFDLIADPHLSIENKRRLADEIAAGEVASIPGLIEHLSDQRKAWGQSTLGQLSSELLYRIITPPEYESEFATPALAKKGGRRFRIEDWPDWWSRNSRKTQEELWEQSAQWIDSFYRRGGRVQVVRSRHPKAVAEAEDEPATKQSAPKDSGGSRRVVRPSDD